jgi:chromosome segregation ATPase
MAATPVNTRNSTKAVATKWGNFETALKELSPVSQHFVQAEQLGTQVEELKKELRGKIHENEQEKNAREIMLQDFGNNYADWRRDRSKLEQERKDLKQKITQIESKNAQIESETLRKLQREVESLNKKVEQREEALSREKTLRAGTKQLGNQNFKDKLHDFETGQNLMVVEGGKVFIYLLARLDLTGG